jgi:hypothetical protein
MSPMGYKRFLPLKAASHVAAYFLLLSCPAAVTAYYQMFTGFSSWDDEGTMMMRVKEYLSGFRLYDEVFSRYGPAYYSYSWFVHFVTMTPVTHDVTRMTSVVLWAICPLICAWIILRLTGFVPVAAAAYILTLRSLTFFGHEPGHPQEFCMLLLVGLAASGLLARGARRRGIAMIFAGAMTALLLLTKVNVGIFAILAVALAVLSQSAATALSRIAAVAAGAAALVLPLALMRIHLDDSLAWTYCVVVTASIAALLPGLFRGRKDAILTFRDCLIGLASFTATVAASWLILIAQRVSSYTILDSLVLSNLRENVSERFWYLPLPLNSICIPWAIGGLLVAILFARVMERAPAKAYELLARIKLIFGNVSFVLMAGPLLAYGLDLQICCLGEPAWLAILPGFITPYCWMVLYAPSEDMQSEQAFPRALLVVAAVLQTLYAYPIAGSQEPFIRVLLLVVAGVSIGDSLSAASRVDRIPTGARQYLPAFSAAFLICFPLYLMHLAYQARSEYRSQPSLALPGAERIHLADAPTYQWLTKKLRQECDVFMGMPDILSLNFWAQQAPPTVFAAGDWMDNLNDEQQSEVAAVLSRHPNACIVYNPDLVAFWNRGNRDLSRLPLVRYIFDHFKTVDEIGMVANGTPSRYYLMVRKERDLPVAASSVQHSSIPQ